MTTLITILAIIAISILAKHACKKCNKKTCKKYPVHPISMEDTFSKKKERKEIKEKQCKIEGILNEDISSAEKSQKLQEQGLTVWQIAEIRQITKDTVEKHLG